MKKALTIALVLCSISLYSQEATTNQDKFKLKINKAIDKIVIDGHLDESAWQNAEIAEDFWQKTPRDDIKANAKTEAKMTYDDQFIYIGGICYGTKGLGGFYLKER